jgi:PAS domain S-box-containing protein
MAKEGREGLLARLRSALPQGRTLPEEVWERRHRALLGLLWVNAAGLFVYALVQGNTLNHAFVECGVIVLPGLLGMVVKSRHARAAFVSFGLITSAAVMVHLSNGVIETHFYFFVLIVALTLYEDWVPFLIALAYVAIHHGLAGTIDAGGVYNHPDAVANPWKWAGIHAGFVLAAAIAAVTAWRLNEDVRHRLTGVVGSSGDAIVELDLKGRITAWNPAAAAMLGFEPADAVGQPLSMLRSEGQVELSELVTAAIADRETAPREIALQTKQGESVPVSLRVSPIRDVRGRLLGTSLVARDVSDRRRAERARERAESYRGVQLAVAGGLAESNSTEEAMPRVVEALGRGLGWDAGLYWRAGEDGALTCDAFWGKRGRELKQFEASTAGLAVPAGEGFLGHVVATAKAAWTERIADDSSFPPGELAAAAGATGAVAFPLMRGGAVIGVLEFFTSEPRAPDADLMQTLSVISDQVGQFTARKDAERDAERVKDEFFGLVSHELRTPLTSVIGYTDMLAKSEGEQLSDRAKKMLDVIQRNAKREMRLVGDLLLLVRIEAGSFDLEPGTVDLAAVAQEAAEAARPAAEGAEMELSLSLGEVPPFSGDSDRIGQAIDNLLTNAIKFTPAGGTVELRIGTAGERALVEVQDSGDGIPPEDQQRLFDRLYRASSATKDHVPGTGLGLTIVKAITEAHGGSVTLESEVGAGSTFRLEFPLKAAAAANGQAGNGSAHATANGNGSRAPERAGVAR